MKPRNLLFSALFAIAIGCIGLGVMQKTSSPSADEPAQKIAQLPTIPEPATTAPANTPTPAKTPAKPSPPVPKEPARPANTAVDEPEQSVVLWDKATLTQSPEGYKYKVNPTAIERLAVGQSLQFHLPELSDKPLTVNIDSRHKRFGDQAVFNARASDAKAGESVTIVRGDDFTFVTIASAQGLFGSSIDNDSGEATLWRESEKNLLAEPFQ